MKKEDCNENAVTSLIMNRVPSAQLLSSVGAEMEFVLSSEHSSGFEALFQEIESKLKVKLGILALQVKQMGHKCN